MYGVSGIWALPGNKEMNIVHKHHVRNGIGDPFIFIQIKASIAVHSNWKIYQNPQEMSKALNTFLPTSFPDLMHYPIVFQTNNMIKKSNEPASASAGAFLHPLHTCFWMFQAGIWLEVVYLI